VLLALSNGLGVALAAVFMRAEARAHLIQRPRAQRASRHKEANR
jgi:hypothetical protein